MARAWVAAGALGCLVATAGCGDDERADRPGWPGNAWGRAPGQTRMRWNETARPWVLGHRGTGADADAEDDPDAENTVPSMLAAIRRQGAVGIELDVRLTADGEVVVLHDARLDRTTDCRGCVSERTLAEVGRCSVTRGVEPSHPPSLAEAYEALSTLPVEPFVTLDAKLETDGCPEPPVATQGPARALGQRIASVVRAVGATLSTSVQGPAELLDGVREVDPGIATWLDAQSLWAAVLAAGSRRDAGVDVAIEHLAREPVDAAHAAGLTVDVFVVDAPVDLALAVLHDVDFLETDRIGDVLDAFDVDD